MANSMSLVTATKRLMHDMHTTGKVIVKIAKARDKQNYFTLCITNTILRCI